MRIRAYREGDADALLAIFRRAVHLIGKDFYSAEQVSAWGGPRVSAESLNRLYTDGRATFIAVDESDSPIAFSDIEADGHVDMLYCDPGHTGKGIATALLRRAEAEALEGGITRLYTEASEAARPLFEKLGFSVKHRRDLEIDGVSIHNWAMEKRLG